MRVLIIAPAPRDQFGMMSGLKVGEYLAVDDEVGQAMVDAGVADYDFSHLKPIIQAFTITTGTIDATVITTESTPVEVVAPADVNPTAIPEPTSVDGIPTEEVLSEVIQPDEINGEVINNV